MNKILMLVALFPFFASAQSNRSANEFAHETVKTYIEKKLYPDQPYTAGDFGKLQLLDRQKNVGRWCVKHEFETLESKYINNEKVIVVKKHLFIFYMDKKMHVVRAEATGNF